jgi:methyltransferase, FkbM family
MLAGRGLRLLARSAGRIAELIDPPPPPPPPPPSPPVVPTEKELAHARWVADHGDKTLRLEYDIQRSDIVVDLGGYEGQWASDIFSRYLCKVHIVEPVTKYAEMIARRFERNEYIRLHKCALGSSHGKLLLSISGDASSAFKEAEVVESAEVVPFDKWMRDQGIGKIALLKINIEGGEYELLEHLVSTGCIEEISNIQVQFHDFVEGADDRMAKIQLALSRTHRRTYHYTYVWENWQLISS